MVFLENSPMSSYVLFLCYQLLAEELLSKHCNKHTFNNKVHDRLKSCHPKLRCARVKERFREGSPVESCNYLSELYQEMINGFIVYTQDKVDSSAGQIDKYIYYDNVQHAVAVPCKQKKG
jgi:hypothetical protein